ncbi:MULTISPECIES: ATP-binding protein [Microbacterium]|uniref:ATP-binding protein n=1 Tax=Microbacterium TaxID=33882 RepID=UPI0004933CE9
MPGEARARVSGPAGLATVDEILDTLERLWSDAPGVPAEDRTVFALAVSEIATNMVQHGEVTAAVTLSVDLSLSSDELRATLVDTAPPASIDWHGVAMPDVDSESGRGLALAREVLDGFVHTYDDRGNTWVLVRRVGISR